MSLKILLLRYTCFAVVATLANLLTQSVVLLWGTSLWQFMAAMFAGTLAGLVVKYVLDKRWIFDDLSSGVRVHTQKFALYTVMGVITTFVFWAFEAAFWFIWQTAFMREAGAVIGLFLGYVVKYNLDKRFVFKSDRRGAVV